MVMVVVIVAGYSEIRDFGGSSQFRGGWNVFSFVRCASNFGFTRVHLDTFFFNRAVQEKVVIYFCLRLIPREHERLLELTKLRGTPARAPGYHLQVLSLAAGTDIPSVS